MLAQLSYQGSSESIAESHKLSDLVLQVLLDLARGLFEETASLDAMMTQVMKEAQQLIPCEHCTVIILDQENEEVHVLYTLLLIETHIYIGTSSIHVCIHTDVCHETASLCFFLSLRIWYSPRLIR